MLCKHTLLGLALASATVIGFAGCGTTTPKEDPKSKTAAPTTAANAKAAEATKPSAPESHAADSGHKTAGGGASAAISANLAKLSPEDRALAEKQKTCPVTDEPLGAMGVPFKVTVKGQTVFLCCSMCEDDVKADPDKALAKFKK